MLEFQWTKFLVVDIQSFMERQKELQKLAETNDKARAELIKSIAHCAKEKKVTNAARKPAR